MPASIAEIHILGLYGRQEISLSLQQGLSIVYGRNGSGKTTTLHVLASLLDGDLDRFTSLRFQEIEVKTHGGSVIELRQTRQTGATRVEILLDGKTLEAVDKEHRTSAATQLLMKEHLGGRCVYLPAFRSILEATSRDRTTFRVGYDPLFGENAPEMERIVAQEIEDQKKGQESIVHPSMRERAQSVAAKTVLCREWFGSFVPVIRCPSLQEVAEELRNEANYAQFRVADEDRDALASVFDDVWNLVGNMLSSNENRTLLQTVEQQLAPLKRPGPRSQQPKGVQQTGPAIDPNTLPARILEAYNRALEKRTRGEQFAYAQLKTFEDSVNKFLEPEKRLSIIGFEARQRRMAMVVLPDGSRRSLSILSSGERHVVTLLFAATHMSSTESIVLIDEPELSLHVEWQRIVLRELMKQAGERQVIACTHSPEVAADYGKSALVHLVARETKPMKDTQGAEE